MKIANALFAALVALTTACTAPNREQEQNLIDPIASEQGTGNEPSLIPACDNGMDFVVVPQIPTEVEIDAEIDGEGLLVSYEIYACKDVRFSGLNFDIWSADDVGFTEDENGLTDETGFVIGKTSEGYESRFETFTLIIDSQYVTRSAPHDFVDQGKVMKYKFEETMRAGDIKSVEFYGQVDSWNLSRAVHFGVYSKLISNGSGANPELPQRIEIQ